MTVVYTHELELETFEVYEARLAELDQVRNAEFVAWLDEVTA